MGVGAAIAAFASGAGAFAAGTTVFGLNFAASSILIGAASFALSGLQKALAPEPKLPNLNGFSSRSQGLTQNIRQPITARRAVYGEARVGGPLVFIESSNDDEFLHLVIVLASHEVEAIDSVWLNDTPITPDQLNGSGVVVSGRYDGLVRIKKHLGTPSQTADSDLVAETSATTDYRFRENAYVYVRLKADRDAFPSRIPTISAFVRGKKVVDTRNSATKWTPNAALLASDYIQADDDDFVPGFGADSADINTNDLNASANVCEEIVDTAEVNEVVQSVDAGGDLIELPSPRTFFQRGDRVRVVTTGTAPGGLSTGTDYYVIPYQRKANDVTGPRIQLATSLDNAIAGTAIDITSAGSGTHTIRKTGEPRYFGGGVIETDRPPGENLKDLLSAMGGDAVYVGGKWKILAASYQSPVNAYDERHIIGPVKIRTKTARRDRFNFVKGVYVSPINDGQPSDYPPVSNSTYESADGNRRLPTDLDLPMTQRPHTAQRLAKIKLEKARQELVVEAQFTLHALRETPGGTIELSLERMGWSSKVFEVIDWSLSATDAGGAPLFVVNLVLQETAAAVYDWNDGEETTVDPAPDTNLPDPFTVSVVAGFSLDSILVDTQSTDKIFKVLATWDAHSDPFVREDGRFEIEFKKSAESVWTSAAKVDGDLNQREITGLEPDTDYDIRIFAFNNLGVKSAETKIENFVVGTTVTTNTEDWENETLGARDGQDWETDSLSSEDWES